MAINFDEWNKQFGGEQAVKDIEKAREQAGEYADLPEGTYVCKLEKLELSASKQNKPMVKGMFRIVEGKHHKQCVFYNAVMAANDPQYNGFLQHKVIEFLRSMHVLDDSEVMFDGDFKNFNDLLLDILEAADEDGLKFEVKTEKDGEYNRITVTDVFE